MTDLVRVFDMNTRTLKNSEKKYSGQKYDDDSTTLHFEYTIDFLKVTTPGVSWSSYIIFDVPDDNGEPQIYSFDGYTFTLNWNITSRVTKSRRVEYQLWFVKTKSVNGVDVDDTEYLLSEIDAVILKPSIPDRPKPRSIIDPEDLNVPPNPPAFTPTVEPDLIGQIDLFKQHMRDYDNPHQVTKAQTGLGLVENHITDVVPTPESVNYVSSGGAYYAIQTVQTDVDTHEADMDNPHGVTKSQVGLGSVVNASMDNEPTENSNNYVKSGGVYTAIGAVQTDVDTHEARTDNPHSVTKAQVGLGNVENASMDASPTENSTNYVSSGGVYTALDGKVDKVTHNSGLYAYANDSSQQQVLISREYTAGAIPRWTEGGQLNAADPSANGNVATKGYVDTADAGKLDKSSTNSTVYAVNGSGAQTNIAYSTTATGDNIVQRKADGQITVAETPDADTDAASKAFVNSSITTATANFLGTYTLTDLGLTYPATNEQIITALTQKVWNPAPTNNDYVFVSIENPNDPGVTEFRRFKYTPNGWLYEYTLNNSSFTQAQWDAINSTITSSKVTSYDTHVASTSNPHSVTKAQVGLGNVDNYASVSAWQSTPDDTHIPTEKLVKDSLDAKVAGPVSSTADHILTFSDATGKVAKDSGYTIQTSVPSGALFTDTYVKQNLKATTDTGTYPVLLKNDATKTDSPRSTTNYTAGVYVQPSTGTITATTFDGALSWSNVTDKPTIDAVPTNGSTNAVQSDGVYDALALKTDKSMAIPLWSDSATYGRDATVVYDDKIYISLADSNQATTSDTTKWRELGQKGDQGDTGDTGRSVQGSISDYVLTVTNYDKDMNVISTTSQNVRGATGATGDRGYSTQGVLESDVLTITNYNSDMEVISEYSQNVRGVGLPSGGTTGQVLYKDSDTDYDFVWDSLPTPPVSSVNNQTGAVTLTATDVGALPSNTTYVSTVNDSSGAVTLKTINSEALTGSGNIQLQVPLVGSGTGQNIRTINNVSILGTGNFEIPIITVDSALDPTSLNPVQNGVIAELIPAEASSSNQLADKAFVNSSITSNTANFLGTYDVVTDLGLTTSATHSDVATALATKMTALSITPTNNDYVYVSFDLSDDPGNVDRYDRYKFNGTAWVYEYTLNNSSFTAAQWAAINSTITSTKVGTYDGYSTTKQDTLVSGTNIKTINSTSLLGSGDIALQTPLTAGTDYQTPLTAGTDYQTPLTAGTDYQVPLVSGTNIKTINSASILGSGNIDLQTPLTAGTDYQTPLTAGTDYQVPLVSGTNIKTINSTSLLGSGDIAIPVITVDNALSGTSTNPVQNKVVKDALDGKQAAMIAGQDYVVPASLGNGDVTKIGTSNVGTDTKPIKLVGGVPTAVTNTLVDVPSAQTVTGLKTLEATGSSASTTSLKLKGDNMDVSANTASGYTTNSVEFLDTDDDTVASISSINSADGLYGVVIGTGNDPTDISTNVSLLAARSDNSKMLLIPPTGSNTSSAVRLDYLNSNTVKNVSYDSTNHKLQKTVGSSTTDVMTVDATPTDGSTNPVMSDGVFDALAGKLELEYAGATNVTLAAGASTSLGYHTITVEAGYTYYSFGWSAGFEVERSIYYNTGYSAGNTIASSVVAKNPTADSQTYRCGEVVYRAKTGSSSFYGFAINNGVALDNTLAVAKAYTDTATAGKVDKVTATTTYAQLYAKSTSGNQVMYNLWGDAAIANTVPLRDATTGAIKVGTPSADADAATKKYVDDSISTATANFLGTLDEVTDLGLTTSATNAQIATALGSYTFSTTPTNNDYVIVTVNVSTTTDVDEYRRFKYDGSAWNYEYTINNTAFSSTQWDAINSGANTTNIGAIANKLDKITSTASYSRMYVAQPDGTQSSIYMTSGLLASSIPARDSSGCITASDPTSSSHVATKNYVDTAIAGVGGDTKVSQTSDASTSTAKPLLISTVTTSGTAAGANYCPSVTVTASTGTVTATAFSGNLTGNVTGNCSGSSGSCTGNAATATTAGTATTLATTSTAAIATTAGVQFYTGTILSQSGDWCIETYVCGTDIMQRATSIADPSCVAVRTSGNSGSTWAGWVYSYAVWKA